MKLKTVLYFYILEVSKFEVKERGKKIKRKKRVLAYTVNSFHEFHLEEINSVLTLVGI